MKDSKAFKFKMNPFKSNTLQVSQNLPVNRGFRIKPLFISFGFRYSIERVFRPRKLDRAHPRELLECAFDIITPVTNSLLPDAETIYTISEIVQEFPGLQVTLSPSR